MGCEVRRALAKQRTTKRRRLKQAGAGDVEQRRQFVLIWHIQMEVLQLLVIRTRFECQNDLLATVVICDSFCFDRDGGMRGLPLVDRFVAGSAGVIAFAFQRFAVGDQLHRRGQKFLGGKDVFLEPTALG